MNSLFNNQTTRFILAWRVYLIALSYFIGTRIVLLLVNYDSSLNSINEIFYIFARGWLYDTVFLIYALLPFSLYLLVAPERWWQSRWNIGFLQLMVFLTIYGLGFIAVAEFLFWDEFNVRFNFISADYLVYRQEVTDNINQSYPIPFILTAIFLISLFVFMWVRPIILQASKVSEGWLYRGQFALANLLLAIICFGIVGQELRDKQTLTYPRELGSNGPYQFFAAFRNNQLNYSEFYLESPENTAGSILRSEVVENNATFIDPDGINIDRKITQPDNYKQINIMLIMVESLSAEYLGVFGNEEGLTPRLDQLSKSSLTFSRMYATGTRTTRGLEAVTLSIPPTPGRSIVKRIGHESNMFSLGNVLREKGYDTSFIYGGRGYFDNMNAFFSGNGYGIIDQTMVPEEEMGFKNAWGMADEYLYKQASKAADLANEENKPFFYHIMTTSNHRPFTYPAGRIDIPSGSGRNGAVKYTDWAIGDFLDKNRNKPWFDNTLFVIIADHTAGSAGKSDLPIANYHIPMFIYAPKIILSGQIDTLSSQIDVAPTLLALTKGNYNSKFFGKNILTMPASEGRALIANYQHLGYYAQDALSILSPGKKIQQYKNPESEQQISVAPEFGDQHLLSAIAYYQGADFIYKNNRNFWHH